MSINTLPHPSQIRLVRNWVWDTLVIDWMDIEITNEGEPVGPAQYYHCPALC